MPVLELPLCAALSATEYFWCYIAQIYSRRFPIEGFLLLRTPVFTHFLLIVDILTLWHVE